MRVTKYSPSRVLYYEMQNVAGDSLADPSINKIPKLFSYSGLKLVITVYQQIYLCVLAITFLSVSEKVNQLLILQIITNYRVFHVKHTQETKH